MLRTSHAAHPGGTPRAFLRTAMLFWRQLAHFQTTSRWHGRGCSPLHDMLSWRPSIIGAIRRPYISSAWTAPRRLAAIEEHYLQLSGPASSLRLVPGEQVRLASIESRGETVDIVLDSPDWFVFEGELTLNLFHEGHRIYTLAFSLAIQDGESAVFIGAIQGFGRDEALEVYRRLTRAFHGLRPRELLIAAFRGLCVETRITRIHAVGDERRVSCDPYFNGPRRQSSSYDAVWSEHGGHSFEDGFFQLPVELPRRSDASVPTRKRNQYRRRYDMLDRLLADLASTLRCRSAS